MKDSIKSDPGIEQSQVYMRGEQHWTELLHTPTIGDKVSNEREYLLFV